MGFIRFLIIIVFIVLLLGGGTLGYCLIEGWSVSDSFYMTVITISTVGFREVNPLSSAGKHLTIILIFASLCTVSYFLTNLVTFIFGGKILQAIKERKMLQFIRQLKNHFIICGGGDVGREVAMELRRAKQRFIIIDQNPQQSEMANDESIPFIAGDAIEDEVQLQAGIKRARGFITALPQDEANAFAVLTARQLNPGLFIVSQAEDDQNVKKLKKAGADRIISPKKIAGKRMASILLNPSVINFLDVITNVHELSLRMDEIIIPPHSPMIAKSMRDVSLGEITGAIVISIYDKNGKMRFNPNSLGTLSTIPLREGDKLIAFGGEKQLNRLKKYIQDGKKL